MNGTPTPATLRSALDKTSAPDDPFTSFTTEVGFRANICDPKVCSSGMAVTALAETTLRELVNELEVTEVRPAADAVRRIAPDAASRHCEKVANPDGVDKEFAEQVRVPSDAESEIVVE